MSAGVPRQLRAVENALRILTEISRPPGSHGLTALAESVGVSKSMAHSLLATLRAQDYVRQRDDGRYLLGPQAVVVGEAARRGLGLRACAAPVMARLAKEGGESVYLIVRSGSSGVLIERADPERTLRVTMEIGEVGPLHAGSSQKAILAFLEEWERDRCLQGELRRLTPFTTVRRDALQAQLADVRRLGYAYTEQESYEGIAGLAAPIFAAGGVVEGSIGVATIVSRLRPRVEELGALVMRAADEISRTRGFTRQPAHEQPG